jgi:hypothetical protein
MIPKTLYLVLLKKLDLDQIAFFDPQLDGVVWPSLRTSGIGAAV